MQWIKGGISIKKQLIKTVNKIIKTDNRQIPFKEGKEFQDGNSNVAKRHAKAINTAKSNVSDEDRKIAYRIRSVYNL